LPGRKSILVVDDDEDICDTLKAVLEEEGYAVAVAWNGAEALALLRETPSKPALVILDILMPVMDGAALYREMKADPALADIPIIISTSDPSKAPSNVLMIRKPVALDLLLDTVRKHC
jgi:CheY-like chemotaxis protein